MTPLHVDIRLAARALRVRPRFAITALLTLALCTGITTAIFSVVESVVLRPLPLPDSGRLVTLCEQYPGATASWCSVSPPNAADIAARSRTLGAIGLARNWGAHLDTRDGATYINAGIANAEFFTALGIRPLLGRALNPSDLIGAPGQVAVVTHRFWQTYLNGDSSAIGRTITLDGTTVMVVGIMPASFRAPMVEEVELWRPLHIRPRDEQHRSWAGFVAFARLRPGTSLAQAQRELNGTNAALKRDYFNTVTNWWINVRSMQDLVVGDAGNTMFLFLAAAALILVIGCANVANLLLVRGLAQRREFAVRNALGATRVALVRPLLVQSLLLAGVGTIMGMGVALAALKLFRVFAPPGIPRLDEIGMHPGVLLFAATLTLVTAVVFGVAPAMLVTRVDPARALREGGRGQTTRTPLLGRVLMIAEVALAVMMLAGAGLLYRTYAAYAAWQPGFETDHLQLFALSASDGTYKHPSDVAALWTRVGDALRTTPGVTAVGLASGGPLFGGRETAAIVSAGVRDGQSPITVRWFDVGAGYFDALGVPLVKGREFGPHDDASAPAVAIVNEAAAQRLWPDGDPIGRRVHQSTDKTEMEIVGVVRNVAPIRPGDVVEPQLYWPQLQQPRWFTYILVRSSVTPPSVMPLLRRALVQIDPALVPGTATTLTERANHERVAPRFNMLLLATFGFTALALAGIGAYGLLSYIVAQHTQEFGVRVALGAKPSQVVFGVLQGGMRLAVPGVMIGLLGAIASGRVMSHFVSGVNPRDPLTLILSGLTLLSVSALACAAPAWRASRVDPRIALDQS